MDPTNPFGIHPPSINGDQLDDQLFSFIYLIYTTFGLGLCYMALRFSKWLTTKTEVEGGARQMEMVPPVSVVVNIMNT
jgi:hypothetical protein